LIDCVYSIDVAAVAKDQELDRIAYVRLDKPDWITICRKKASACNLPDTTLH